MPSSFLWVSLNYDIFHLQLYLLAYFVLYVKITFVVLTILISLWVFTGCYNIPLYSKRLLTQIPLLPVFWKRKLYFFFHSKWGNSIYLLDFIKSQIFSCQLKSKSQDHWEIQFLSDKIPYLFICIHYDFKDKVFKRCIDPKFGHQFKNKHCILFANHGGKNRFNLLIDWKLIVIFD